MPSLYLSLQIYMWVLFPFSPKDIIMKLIYYFFINQQYTVQGVFLISMRRVPELPAGSHKLLAILAEPLKQKENLISLEDPEVSDNLLEFEDWVWSLLLIPMCIFSLCK